MLKVTNLSKSFRSGDTTVKAVDDVTFSLETGSFVSLVGPSGSGKSTLLAILGALEKPSGGSVEVDGQDISELGDSGLTKYRAKNVGFVFQNYNLIPNLSAVENVMLPMEFAGLPSKSRLARAQELLDSVGITDDKQLRKPSRLSGGEQQRVAIARALANNPKIILADEPTGNLDSQTGKMVFRLLQDLAKKQNTTVIVATHDLEIAGKTNAKLSLSDGKLKRSK
ncbi:MAG TPA: ABC transporter ATP-binding protein [Candidatus Binatia bacterium]|nr:ABC transporter ATP-binding protein [Candidatus Binatia bacterium]